MAADRTVGGARRGAEYLAASAKITDDGRSRSLCLSLKHDFFPLEYKWIYPSVIPHLYSQSIAVSNSIENGNSRSPSGLNSPVDR